MSLRIMTLCGWSKATSACECVSACALSCRPNKGPSCCFTFANRKNLEHAFFFQVPNWTRLDSLYKYGNISINSLASLLLLLSLSLLFLFEGGKILLPEEVCAARPKHFF